MHQSLKVCLMVRIRRYDMLYLLYLLSRPAGHREVQTAQSSWASQRHGPQFFSIAQYHPIHYLLQSIHVCSSSFFFSACNIFNDSTVPSTSDLHLSTVSSDYDHHLSAISDIRFPLSETTPLRSLGTAI